MSHKKNCIFCGGKRTLANVENYLKCEECSKEFYTTTRKKSVDFDDDDKKTIKKANKYRSKTCYDSLKTLSVSERENVRDTMLYKNFSFRHGSAKWKLELDDEKQVWFIGNIAIDVDENGKYIQEEIKGLTDISIEEYHMVKQYDEKFNRQVHLSPIYPFNLFISFLRERNIDEERTKRNIIEIGTKLTFDNSIACIKINDKTIVLREKFPRDDINKLLKKANKEQSKGNLPKKSEYHQKSSKKTKGTYRRFVEKCQKITQEELKLKTNKRIKYKWYIENSEQLRKMHSQFHRQGWKPTVLKYCLEEKQNRVDIEIIERNIYHTARICPECLKIYSLEEKQAMKTLQCECGYSSDWKESTARNILGGIYGKKCKKCSEVNVIQKNEINDEVIVGVDCQFCGSFIKIS